MVWIVYSVLFVFPLLGLGTLVTHKSSLEVEIGWSMLLLIDSDKDEFLHYALKNVSILQPIFTIKLHNQLKPNVRPKKDSAFGWLSKQLAEKIFVTSRLIFNTIYHEIISETTKSFCLLYLESFGYNQKYLAYSYDFFLV